MNFAATVVRPVLLAGVGFHFSGNLFAFAAFVMKLSLSQVLTEVQKR